MNIAFQFEGVLARDDGTYAPVMESLDLLNAAGSSGRATVLAEASEEVVRRFCAVHGVTEAVEIVSGSDRPTRASDSEPLVVRQVVHLLASEGRLDTVVVADPSVAPALLRRRLAVLVFLRGSVTPPRWWPDGDGRPSWGDIEREMDERVL